MRSTSAFAIVASVGMGLAVSSVNAQTLEESVDLEQGRSELREAREALEAAAREVARLSAQEEREVRVFIRNSAPLTFDHLDPGGPNYFYRNIPAPPLGGALTGPTFNVFVGAGRWRDMELVELTPMLGNYFGADAGILVVRAPSDTSELQDGDVILEIGSRTPNSTEHAMRILGSFEPGEILELTIMRDQRQQTLEIELLNRE